VLIVDDHRMFVDSLVRLLEDEADLVVVAVASSIAEAIESVRTHDPDVVLLDYRLPDGDAPACIARLRTLAPAARVLVMTGLGDDATLAAARDSGCAGVVTKDKAARDLVEGIRLVAAGELLAGPGASDRAGARGDRKLSDPGLTPRERGVLEALAAGNSTDNIAASLHISRVTVRNHIQRILAKLGARSRLEAVALGIRAGIIAPPAANPQPPA
jgi:DNA-binding NarL/FixJ family response regulator